MAIIERPSTPAVVGAASAPAVVTPSDAYRVVAIFVFLVGGLEALLIRAQLAGPNGTVLSADLYNQMFTMHATTMV